jgi:uncharacterized protein YbaP (TraB family)
MFIKQLTTYWFGLFFLSCQSQPLQLKTASSNNTLLWEISGNGLAQPSYFLGTMHILCISDAHLSEQVQTVLDKVSSVYFEIDLDDMAQMFGALKAMTMKDGQTLQALLSPEDYQKVVKFFEGKTPLPFKMLESYKPLLLSSMVAEELLSCETAQGMEMLLMEEANKRKLEINGLETMAYQVGLFDSIPYPEQAKALIESIDSLAKQQVEVDKLLAAYRNQDLSALEKLTAEDESGIGGNLDLLLYGRNKNWVEQFKVMASKSSILLAVGAGHLPGEKGVLELLRKNGYTLRPLENTITSTKKSL